MALATLCSKITQLQDQYPELRNIRLQAFVVDHKARPESTPEARQVARCLERKLGSSLAKPFGRFLFTYFR